MGYTTMKLPLLKYEPIDVTTNPINLSFSIDALNSWKPKQDFSIKVPDLALSLTDLFQKYDAKLYLNLLLSDQLTKPLSNGKDYISSLKSLGASLGSTFISAGVNLLTDKLFDTDNELGRSLGTLFSSGVNSTTNSITNNILKGTSLMDGLSKDVGSSLAGAGAGLAANYLGKGITSMMGDSRLGRAVGQGVATGLGTIGGTVASNLVKYGTTVGKTAAGAKAASIFGKGAGAINPYALGATVLGTALGAATGPSKEYFGKYGGITQGMDTAYDITTVAANAIPVAGQMISGMMTLNKGLSNIFGSTDGMTKTDAILGSAWMPAPVKWVNMWGSSKTGDFFNLSWQNSEKANSFMGNAFGDLGDRFLRAREEANKTYGTFSHGAKKRALDNIDFANSAWGKILAMADLNEYQNIRSQYMSSINNLRYAQNIQGGWTPLYRGKQGMKIFNNATNHNMGMRLLSAAALIDNKQMILSALTGVKFSKILYTKPIVKSDNIRILKPVVVEYIERKLLPGLQFFSNHGLIIVVKPKQEIVLLDNRDSKVREESHKKSVQIRKQELMKKAEEKTALVAGAILEKTMPSYWILLATGQDLGTVGSLSVDLVSPFVLGKGLQLTEKLLLRGFKLGFNKAGLLAKVPINKFTTAKSVYNEGNMTPMEVLQSTGKGISDVYKTYSPGGAWYLRLLANGISKEETDKLVSEYLKNLRKTTFKITDSPLSDAVAVTGGEIRNGEIIPEITMDPKYAPSSLLVRSAASHEGGHASTLNLESKNSPYRESENEKFYLLVERKNPEITKAMEYNESLRPLIKDATLDELILDETGNVEKHLNNVVTSLEIRQRALASEIDASNKGVTMDEYINNPNLWDLNFKLLMEIFEKEGIRNYMQHFKSLIPITIGSSTTTTLYNTNK